MNQRALILKCPLTMDFFTDPVTVDCGHSFERSALAKSCEAIGHSCPTCRAHILKNIKDYSTNYALRDIAELESQNNKSKSKAEKELPSNLSISASQTSDTKKAAFSMQLFFRTFTGNTTKIQAQSSDTIGQLQQRYQEIKGIPPEYSNTISLLFFGKKLDHSKKVADYNIKPEETLMVHILGL